MLSAKKRNRRTLEEKWQVIQNSNDRAGMERTDIAAHVKIKPQILPDLLKTADEVKRGHSRGDILTVRQRVWLLQ